jgi:hypothetical protein
MRVPFGDQANVRSTPPTGCDPSSQVSKQPRIGSGVPNGAVVRTFTKVRLASAKASHLPSGDQDGPAVAFPPWVIRVLLEPSARMTQTSRTPAAGSWI